LVIPVQPTPLGATVESVLAVGRADLDAMRGREQAARDALASSTPRCARRH